MSHPLSKNHLLITALACVAVGGASFYGGMLYGKAGSPQGGDRGGRGQFAGGPGGRQGGFARGANGGFVGGTVISKDDKSLTVEQRNNGSKIVFFTDKTQTMRSVTGTLDDVAVGATIMVQGSANPDGSVTAESIQIRPSMPPGQDRGPGPQATSTTK